MQIFELHFNPKNKENKLFDSFIYEPENQSEARLGNLYIVGELTKILPQNSKFLDALTLVIKKEYYSSSLQKSSEAGLKEAMKKANEFLDKEARHGNVNWLGNLHFAILNFKDFILNFTKVGGMKILLSRDEELLDIGQNIEFQEADPYPLKVFGSVATGKLAPNDKIIILTKDLFSVLEASSFLNQLKEVSSEKELKRILKEQKSFLSEASGICLLLLAGESQKETGKMTLNSKRSLPKIQYPKIKFSPTIKLPHLNKNKVLIPLLCLMLAAGFLAFRQEENSTIKTINDQENKLELAKSKISMAENFLIFKEGGKAKDFFLEAQNILASLIQQNSPLSEEASSLQKTVEDYLNH